MKKVDIYTDGACSGNPGAGGWCAILMYMGHEKMVSGYNKDTTNNRMEIFAVIQGLKQLKESCEVHVYSDSAYVVNAFNEHWIEKWQSKNWMLTRTSRVKNDDLWRMLVMECAQHKVTFHKVKGHADNEYNNKCDKQAVLETNTAIKIIEAENNEKKTS